MIIGTKFSIGDVLLYEDCGPQQSSPCEFCQSTGRVELGNNGEAKKFFDCPNCYGNGKVYNTTKMTREFIVSKISLDLYGDGSKNVRYHYFFGGSSNDDDYVCEDEILGKIS